MVQACESSLNLDRFKHLCVNILSVCPPFHGGNIFVEPSLSSKISHRIMVIYSFCFPDLDFLLTL